MNLTTYRLLFVAKPPDCDITCRLISDAAYEWSIERYVFTDASEALQGCTLSGFLVWLIDVKEVQVTGFGECIKGKLQQWERDNGDTKI